MGLTVNRKMVKKSIDIFSQLLAKKINLKLFLLTVTEKINRQP